MKVLVSVPVNPYTGYGNDGISLLRALTAWGADVYLQPSSVHPPLPRDIAALFTKPIPDHVDLHISHRCPQELAHPAHVGIRAHATVTLAWTMHEWDSLDNIDEINQSNCEHAFSVRQNLAASLSRFDAVLAYDEVSRVAMEPYHRHVSVLQGGVEARPHLLRDFDAKPFRFLMLGALSARKNPWAAINAFRILREDHGLTDIELVLKTASPGLHPAMEQWLPGLRIITRILSEEEITQLYGTCQVMLAPSWGEGKSIPAAQFAMTGGAVVAPEIGGFSQWFSPSYGFPVPFELAEWSPGVRGAKVNPADLAEVMLDLYDNPREAERRGAIAARVLPQMMSWDAVLERLMLRLPELAPGGRGQEVGVLMRVCRRPSAPSDAKVAQREMVGLDS